MQADMVFDLRRLCRPAGRHTTCDLGYRAAARYALMACYRPSANTHALTYQLALYNKSESFVLG